MRIFLIVTLVGFLFGCTDADTSSSKPDKEGSLVRDISNTGETFCIIEDPNQKACKAIYYFYSSKSGLKMLQMSLLQLSRNEVITAYGEVSQINRALDYDTKANSFLIRSISIFSLADTLPDGPRNRACNIQFDNASLSFNPDPNLFENISTSAPYFTEKPNAIARLKNDDLPGFLIESGEDHDVGVIDGYREFIAKHPGVNSFIKNINCVILGSLRSPDGKKEIDAVIFEDHSGKHQIQPSPSVSNVNRGFYLGIQVTQ